MKVPHMLEMESFLYGVYFRYTMTVTTIKLQRSTKNALDNFKSKVDSYDSVIRKLVFTVQQKNLKSQLIEAYKKMGKEDLDTLEEWEPASHEMHDRD